MVPSGRPARPIRQQPIEADLTVSACAAAFLATGEACWLEEAMLALRWFLGDNDLGVPVFDPQSGGCRDGLGPSGVSENQGAEPTLAWLSALVRAQELQAAGAFGWTHDGNIVPVSLVARTPETVPVAAVASSRPS